MRLTGTGRNRSHRFWTRVRTRCG